MGKEIINSPEENRYTIFPIRDHTVWNMYKKAESSMWKAQEIDFSKDYVDFIELNKDEQHFIKMILAFFAASDTIVNINLEKNFINEITILEAKYFYQYQAANENVHSETYSLLIDTLIKDTTEKTRLFNAIETIDCIKQKKLWADKWIENANIIPFSQRLVAFAIVEGVFFSGAFCAIYWIKEKKKGKMEALTVSNEFISRDEGLHTDFACLLYSKIINRLKKEVIYDMFNEAIKIETNFICDSLPCKLIGMNSSKMIEYIKYVADRLIVNLGYPKLYNIKQCPFTFMDKISVEGKTNFFEKRVTEYQKGVVPDTYVFNEDF